MVLYLITKGSVLLIHHSSGSLLGDFSYTTDIESFSFARFTSSSILLSGSLKTQPKKGFIYKIDNPVVARRQLLAGLTAVSGSVTLSAVIPSGISSVTGAAPTAVSSAIISASGIATSSSPPSILSGIF